MEFQQLCSIIYQAGSFLIVADEIAQDLGYTTSALIEDEVLISTSYCKSIYSESLSRIKKYREKNEWTDDLKFFLDLAVLINGELPMAWNVKKENLSKLDIKQQLHINKLSVKLHRKAAVAWEFRKFLISIEKPDNELVTLKELQEIHKQNYYLWEYKRWFFETQLSTPEQEKEFQDTLDYCSTHLSDSSAFHYLAHSSSILCKNAFTFNWVEKICQRFYGKEGLYNEKNPPGYETLCLLRAKTRKSKDQDRDFYQEQSDLNRKTSVLYLKD
jgi:hypothetical protein